MLCNIVLNGIEKVVYTYNRDPEGRRYDGRKTIQYLIRYADDFVVLSRNYQDLVNVKRLIERFLSTRGLKYSEGKTSIVHVHDGFNFLG
jgi:RNA-directed DNA polymerase